MKEQLAVAPDYTEVGYRGETAGGVHFEIVGQTARGISVRYKQTLEGGTEFSIVKTTSPGNLSDLHKLIDYLAQTFEEGLGILNGDKSPEKER